jgi:hypothetical protein
MEQTKINNINFANFMIINSKKNQNELLEEFKNHINHCINEIPNNYTDSYEDLIIKSKTFSNNFYFLLIKIKFYLSILEIKDESQTNKFAYGRCCEVASFIHFTNISHICQKLYHFIDNDLDIDNEKICNISKMYTCNKSDCLNNEDIINNQKDNINNYKDNVNKQIVDSHQQCIRQFNNYIDTILLEILCVNEIIKNIYISKY